MKIPSNIKGDFESLIPLEDDLYDTYDMNNSQYTTYHSNVERDFGRPIDRVTFRGKPVIKYG